MESRVRRKDREGIGVGGIGRKKGNTKGKITRVCVFVHVGPRMETGYQPPSGKPFSHLNYKMTSDSPQLLCGALWVNPTRARPALNHVRVLCFGP